MTRAALLHLFDSPEALPTAVQDLEQLAQAFPYCQTAHLLLAKAAHDQGSMLAGQRLRRAATYAADRHLLRLLLERPVPQLVSAQAPAFVLPKEPETIQPVDEGEKVEPIPLSIAAETAPEVPPAATAPLAASALASELLPVAIAGEEAPSAEKLADSEDEVSVSSSETEVVVEEPVILSEELPTETAVITAFLPEAETEEAQASLAVQVATEEPLLSAVPNVAAEPEEAPLPIRPSVEAGTARFEFGLSPRLEAGFSTYQLPELLADEPAAAPSHAAPATITAFLGSADLAYALGGGSRLGYALQHMPEADAAREQPAAPMPGEVLPPAGEFFAPDALVLEHLARQPPPAPPAASSFDLIDSFLRRAPQRRRGIVTLLTVPEQADLSIRSTQAESGLASESLARILAGQGKIDRAITVYERLMVRQPEKSAYFAVQMELLRNPPTPSS